MNICKTAFTKAERNIQRGEKKFSPHKKRGLSGLSSVCAFLLTVFLLMPVLSTQTQASTAATVSSLMTTLKQSTKDSLYNTSLNAPFSKESSGIRESVSTETGAMTVSHTLLSIPGRAGMDIDLRLVYNNQSAKLFDEGTSSAAITKSAGTVVTAYYEVYDSYGNWLRTAAQQFSSSEQTLIERLTQTQPSGTTIQGNITSGNETWVFNGYYEVSGATSLSTSDSIANITRARSVTDAAKNIFGAGWSLDLPTLSVDSGSIYVTLADGQTYLYDSTNPTGLKNYILGDVSFGTDTSVTNGTDTSAYKLRYANGFTQYYSSYGDILLETDRFGNQITYYWTTSNGLRLLTKIVDSAGREVTLDYNDSGTTIRYDNKTISLTKTPISGYVGKYCLSGYTDANGNTTSYTYTYDSANFDLLGKTAAANTYANLSSITYQTGLRTSYQYSSSTKNLGTSGSMSYFKVAKRWDSYDNTEYSTQEYSYSGEPDGYPTYKASTIPMDYSYSTKVCNKGGETVTYYYNYKHLCVKTESSTDVLTTTKDTWFDTNKNVPVKEVITKTANGLSHISSIDTYEYDSMGNMVSENHPIDPADLDGGEYITRYAYDTSYNILTGKSYKQDKNTTITEKYALSGDKKSVATAEISSNNALVKKACYEYSSNGNLLKSAAMMDSDSWSITSYTYGGEYKEMYPTLIVCAESDTSSGGNSVKLKSNAATYDFYTGNTLTSTDGNGNTTSYEYDVLGRVVRELLPDGHSRTTKYDDKKNTVLTTDAEGGTLLYSYDPAGLLVSVTKTLTGEVIARNSYDAKGNLISSTDGNGNVTVYTYDALDRLKSNILTDKSGKITSKKTVAYTDNFKDQYGKVYYKVAVTTAGDVKSLTTESYFNARDQLVKESRVGASTVQFRTYTFDYLSNTLSITGYDGTKMSYTYNAFGRGLTATDRNGNISRFSYDMLGNQLTATNAIGVTQTTHYDALGNATSVSVPQDDGRNAVTKYYYDLNGSLVKTVDAKGYVTKQNYDKRDLLTAVEQVISPKKSMIVKLSYDGEGREVARVTGLSGEGDTSFSIQTRKYDAYGHLILETDTASKNTTYTYDANGNVISCTDRNGVTTYNSYDGLNRLIQKYNSKDGKTTATTCVYDLNGALKSSTNSSSSAAYAYDGFGRVTEIKFGNGVKKSYTYDAGDRVTSYAIKIGSVEEYKTKYEYDVGGRRTAVVYNGLRSTYTYNATNQLVSETNGLTGAVTTYKYTPTGATKAIDTKLADKLVNHYEYKFDLVGNETEKLENGKTTTYTYDALSRLVTAALPDGTAQNYEYDDYGNISSLTELSGNRVSETLYYYDKAGRLTLKNCDKDGTQSRFEYDACGNLLYREDMTTQSGGSASSASRYTYNGYNQLVRTVNSYGETAEYTYDTEGLRNGKASAEETTRYICEGGNVVLETDGTGKVTAKNIWGSKLLERDSNDQTYSYFFNGHGDITALTDKHGYVLEDYDYDPYGNELTDTAKVGAGYSWQVSQTTYYDNPFRYCGEMYDEETGLYYLRARYYSPDIQRFISEDTYRGRINNPLTLNLYTYCGNNPIIFTDRSGHRYDDDPRFQKSNGYRDEKGNYQKGKQPASTKTTTTSDNKSSDSSNSSKSSSNNAIPFNKSGIITSYIGGGIEFGSEALKGYIPYALKNSLKPDNIGIGILNKQVASEIKLSNSIFENGTIAGKAVGGFAVFVNVLVGANENIKAGASDKKIVSDAIVDTGFGTGSVLLSTSIGGAVGGPAGVVVGLLAGGIYDHYTDKVKDRVSDLYQEGIEEYYGDLAQAEDNTSYVFRSRGVIGY